MSLIQEHMSKALEEYTKKEYYNDLLAAKEKYFELTGPTNENDGNYENKMSFFNDWYLLHFSPESGREAPIKRYIQKHGLESELSEALLGCGYSIFEYQGMNFKKREVLKNIVSKDKVLLALDHPAVPLLKSDLFIGRLAIYKEEGFLLNGRCVLPQESKSILKKQISRVRKSKEEEAVKNFLFAVERLNTKMARYGHVDVAKIFVF